MARRKAEHAAHSGFAFGDDEPVAFPVRRRVRLQGRKIVVEDERMPVIGIAGAARAQGARAKIAVRVMG